MSWRVGLALPFLAATATVADDALPDAAPACPEGAEARIHVTVTGFRDGRGNISVELYPANDHDFIVKLLTRVRFRTPANADPTACIAAPKPGPYTLVVLHDRDDDRHLGVFVDGFGLSNNPALGWSKPKAAPSVFEAKPGDTHLTVVLNYQMGLGARPLKPDERLRR